MPAALRQRVSLATHDPDDRRELAYLAADEAGEPILINRALHEADVVLPVGCLRGEQSAGYFGIHGVVYPTFSDSRTLQRFRAIGTLNGQAARRRELVADVDHVAWLLGITLTVQLVPAAGEGVLQVLAGLSDSVRHAGHDRYHAAWDWPVERRADLVLAAIEGGPGQQTWENLGRRWMLPRTSSSEGGAIAVCCELSAPPGPAMQHLAGESRARRPCGTSPRNGPSTPCPPPSWPTPWIARKVYLLSRLDAAVVEDLEMIPIGGADELARLARKHRSCVLLSNAANVTVVGDEGLRGWAMD